MDNTAAHTAAAALAAATAELHTARADHLMACDILEMSQDTGLSRRAMRALETDCHTAYDRVQSAHAAWIAVQS